MSKRPNVSALAKDFLDREAGKSKEHPLRNILNDETPGRVVFIPLALLRANPDQPRKHFDRAALEDLTASIKEQGILEPILAYKDQDGEGYVIIAGERRWRASKAAGLTEMPVMVHRKDEALELAIIENLQREDLNPMEEAEALSNLKALKGYTDAELAKKIGKSRSSVPNSSPSTAFPKTSRRSVGRPTLGPRVRCSRFSAPAHPIASERRGTHFTGAREAPSESSENKRNGLRRRNGSHMSGRSGRRVGSIRSASPLRKPTSRQTRSRPRSRMHSIACSTR